MHRIHLALMTLALAIPATGSAQSEALPVGSAGAASEDTTTPAPKKKKGGLFGKAKGLAKNKVVKTIAKTAACTMLPGGQVIAGAIDGGAEGAAAGVATGQAGCMPGAGLLGNPAAAAQEAAAAKAAGAAGLAGGVPGVAVPGMPTVPGQGFSADQMKQLEEQYRRMGVDPKQLEAMQEMMAGMPGASPADPVQPSAPESPNRVPALVRENGRILVRHLPWLPGSEALEQGGDPMFGMAMQEVALEIKATGKRYKIEARVEDQGDKVRNRLLSQKRGAAVLSGLTARGVPAERLTVAEGKSDKDPRIIVSKSK